MNFFVNEGFRLKRTLLVILLIISSLLNIIQIEHVKAAIGDWVITDEDGKKVEGDYIVWQGTHSAAGDNSIRYRTFSYRMSRQRYDTSIKFSSGSNASIRSQNISINNEGGYDYGGLKIRNYSITRKDFIKAATSLGITADDVLNGGATVYLNPVYETYQGDITRKSNIFGLQEMLAAEAWSGTTRSLLPNLYNISYTITADNIYDVKVVAVDSKGGTVLKTLKSNDKVIYGQAYQTEIRESDKTITSSGMSYQFTGKWYYKYTNRNPVQEMTTNNYSVYEEASGKTYAKISEVPDALDLTVCLIYEPQESFYYIDVYAMDEDYNVIAPLDKDLKVKAGEPFTYPINSQNETLQGKYRYDKKWAFNYLEDLGNGKSEMKRIGINTGNISISPLPKATDRTTANLYLYYVRDNTLTPTPSPIPGVSPTPTPTPVPRPPMPTVPNGGRVKVEMRDAQAVGAIRADNRGNERFIADQSIPTTESLYTQVQATEYLLGYGFSKKVGLKYYPVEVRKDYILKWKSATPDTAGGGKEQQETVTVKKVIMVPRAYGYWKIDFIDYFKIGSAKLNNYALPNGSVTLYPNSAYYSVPSLSYTHNDDEDYHIIPPTEVTTGITLPASTIQGDTTKPSIPKEDDLFVYEAYTRTGMAKVRSDRVVFDGKVVMSDAITETEAPDLNLNNIDYTLDLSNKDAMYKKDLVIEATKENGEYASSGTVDYVCLSSDVSTKVNTITYNIQGLDPVVIHTPVVCIPIVSADNDKYVQLVNPESDAVHLVIDSNPSLNDFTVRISNTALHSNKLGYYTRDFSKSLRNPNISYIQSESGLLKNQVRFPFDVYIDVGSDGDITNDDYIKAGRWVTLDRNTARFYLPMWVEEGVYDAEFRTIAVNAVGKLSGFNVDKITREERKRNTLRSNYVATNTVKFQISGRIYGLTIYDITDYPIWEEAFRVPDSNKFKKYERDKYPDGTNKSSYSKNYSYDYTLGTNDQYGNDTGRDIKYTFPLVNGSHPYYKNMGILKTGYMVRFSLETTGYMYSRGDMISITPSFYFVDRNGQNRQAVDLYYNEEFNKEYQRLVKIGSSRDKINIKSLTMGDLYHGIPKAEIEQTAKVLGVSFDTLYWRHGPMFTFSNIRLTEVFRTFVGTDYAKKIKSLPSYSAVSANGITEAEMIKRTQRWYGYYYLPNYVYAVPKGYDVIGYSQKYGIDYYEDFWLKDGYIIVSFNIETVNKEGKRHLSYVNPTNYMENGHCSMWVLEGPPLEKTNYDGTKFKFYAGDFFIYDIGKRASDDYSSGAIY